MQNICYSEFCGFAIIKRVLQFENGRFSCDISTYFYPSSLLLNYGKIADTRVRIVIINTFNQVVSFRSAWGDPASKSKVKPIEKAGRNNLGTLKDAPPLPGISAKRDQTTNGLYFYIKLCVCENVPSFP